jgi:hypothetical protein
VILNNLHTPKVGALSPPHDPLEPFAYPNNKLHPPTFASLNEIYGIPTPSRGGNEVKTRYFPTDIPSPTTRFLAMPPPPCHQCMCPPSPPIIFVKGSHQPTCAVVVVVVCSGVRERPQLFYFLRPKKSEYEEAKIARNNSGFFSLNRPLVIYQ